MELAIPGNASGKVTLLSDLPLDAPNECAASSNAGSIDDNTPTNNKNAVGKYANGSTITNPVNP